MKVVVIGGAQASAALIDCAEPIVFPGASQGITDTLEEQLGKICLPTSTPRRAFLSSSVPRLERTTHERRRDHP